MKLFNWENAIAPNILQLKLVGLWPKNAFYEKDLYTLWSLFVIIFFICGHTSTQFTYMILSVDTFKAFTSALSVLVAQIGGVLKICYLIRNMRVLKRLMSMLKRDVFQPEDKTQEETAVGHLNVWRKVFRMYWGSTLSTMFFLGVYPIIDRNSGFNLPFAASFPFNTKKSPNYQIAYLFQILGMCCVSSYILGIDLLITALNIYIIAHLDVLCCKIRGIFEGESSHFHQKLVNCILHHKKVLEFAGVTNQFYNWMVFTQFFISATAIGITLYQISTVEPTTSEFGVFLCYEATVLLQLFMYCWFGNNVEVKSEDVRDAIFDSEWTKAPLKVQKSLLLFGIRSQKTLKISALNLFYLSLDTFITILKTSWSYYTLLHNISLNN